MKRLTVFSAAAVLALCLGTAATARANEEATAKTWPGDARFVVLEPGTTLAPGTRVYYLSDDPSYDLSGSGNTLYLVDDGGAYTASSWTAPAAYLRTSTAPHEVVAVQSEYRQDWMAVAAGDRPVRCLTSVPIMTPAPSMTTVPSDRIYYQDTSDYGRYRSGRAAYASTNPSRHAAMTKQAMRRHHRAAMAAARRPAKRHYYSQAEFTATQPAVVSEGTGAGIAVGRDLYQIGHSWYTMEDDSWCRAESWRGPFVRVHKGSVPREVIESANRESHFSPAMGSSD